MSIQPYLIWFQLVGSDGNPYMGTSATSVSDLPVTIVDTFRDAIKAKNPNKLSAFDASNLKVYKNKAAFDAKEQDLKSSFLISGLGTSEEDALIVLVPPVVGSHCPNPFYNQLPEPNLDDEWLEFHDNIADTDVKKIYIRQCYKTIASEIIHSPHNLVKKIMVTGTPGVGKSFFLFYLLCLLVKERKRVLFIYLSDIIYFDGQGGIHELEM